MYLYVKANRVKCVFLTCFSRAALLCSLLPEVNASFSVCKLQIKLWVSENRLSKTPSCFPAVPGQLQAVAELLHLLHHPDAVGFVVCEVAVRLREAETEMRMGSSESWTWDRTERGSCLAGRPELLPLFLDGFLLGFFLFLGLLCRLSCRLLLLLPLHPRCVLLRLTRLHT